MHHIYQIDAVGLQYTCKAEEILLLQPAEHVHQGFFCFSKYGVQKIVASSEKVMVPDDNAATFLTRGQSDLVPETVQLCEKLESPTSIPKMSTSDKFSAVDATVQTPKKNPQAKCIGLTSIDATSPALLSTPVRPTSLLAVASAHSNENSINSKANTPTSRKQIKLFSPLASPTPSPSKRLNLHGSGIGKRLDFFDENESPSKRKTTHKVLDYKSPKKKLSNIARARLKQQLKNK